MSHIFDQTQFKKLDSPKRREAMPPELVCQQLSLSKEMTVADVGCGVGFFTFPFSELVKNVYAIDISSIMIDELNKRISTQANILTYLGDFNDLLENESLDLFFTSNLIHELEDLPSFTKSAINKLKTNGRIAYLDFNKVKADFGPSYEKRIATDTVIDLFESLHLNSIEKHQVKDNFYLVIATK